MMAIPSCYVLEIEPSISHDEVIRQANQEFSLLLAADRVEEVERNMREAMEMHIRGLLEDNSSVPASHAFSENEYSCLQPEVYVN